MIQLLIILGVVLGIIAALVGPIYPWLQSRADSEQNLGRQKIICFSGQKFNGKDTAADYLAQRLEEITGEQWDRVAFADEVKEVFMEAYDKDRAWVEKWKRKSTPPPGFKKTVREALMFIGDGFRQIQPMVWIDLLYRNNPSHNLIISDGRYDSEVTSVHDRDGVAILVWRPGHENDINHDSEKQIVPHLKTLKEQGLQGAIEEPGVPFDWLLVNDSSAIAMHNKIDTELIPYLKTRLAI